jgi:gluconate 5-dehydrogenase
VSHPFRLDGKQALITGALGGLGAAITKALCDAGAQVILAGRDARALDDGVTSITASGGRAAKLCFDITSREDCDRAIATTLSESGGLDILVNCAGMIGRGALAESTDEDWDAIVETNLTAPYRLSRAVAPGMVERRWGRILNIGSILSVIGKTSALSYVASKHGLAGLTKALACELGPSGVCVNAICPGYFKTELTLPLQNDAEFNRFVEQRTPLRRWGEPREVGEAAVFLCSDAASYINGHLLMIDGGMTTTH